MDRVGLEKRAAEIVDLFEQCAEARAEVARLTREISDVVMRYAADKAQFHRTMADQHRVAAEWQSLATRAVEALRTVLSRNGCAGCIPADRAPSYVRGKPLRLSVDEHEGDCVTIVALAAIADFDAAGNTTALDEYVNAKVLAAVNEATERYGKLRPLFLDAQRVAQEAREAALEEAAKLIEPKEPRPESPDLSAYTNHDDAAFDWASHELTVAAAKIRALAKRSTP